MVFERQASERLFRLGGCQRIAQTNLGLCMDGAAQGDHFGQQRICCFDPGVHPGCFRHVVFPRAGLAVGQTPLVLAPARQCFISAMSHNPGSIPKSADLLQKTNSVKPETSSVPVTGQGA